MDHCTLTVCLEIVLKLKAELVRYYQQSKLSHSLDKQKTALGSDPIAEARIGFSSKVC